MKKIKNIARTKLKFSSFICSKICITHTINLIDTSHFNFLVGYKKSLLSIIDPSSIEFSLRMGLLAIQKIIRLRKYRIHFIVNIEDIGLLNEFYEICMRKKLKINFESEWQRCRSNFLTLDRPKKVLIIALFLTPTILNSVQNECTTLGLPLISFNNLLTNKMTSFIHVGGNFTENYIQSYVIRLLTLCLKKNYEFI